jgi:alkylated DNA nucleotide flippase Atl1
LYGPLRTYSATPSYDYCRLPTPWARAEGRILLRIVPESLNLPSHRVICAGGRIVFQKPSREAIPERQILGR